PYASYLCVSAAIFFNPASIDMLMLANTGTNYSFSKYYKTPHISKRPKNKRNFVYIYAESLERTYFDEAIFPGLIKGLRDLESHSNYFTNINGVANTGWTVAGITASQCGIPLFSPSHANSMSGMDKFLAGATCLGDLLKEEGYQLSYLGGAPLSFAGKGKLFSTHGFDSVRGIVELNDLLPVKYYKNAWGLFDDTLFDIALKDFNALSSSGKPFGMFMLTLDTHHPNGHPSKNCKGILYKNGSNPILNAVACSDYLISRFAKEIMQSPYGDNTEIFIASDHLGMRNTAFELLKKGNRKNLFMAIDPKDKGPNKVSKKGSTLDIAPTVLHFLGYEGEIGLGRNLMGNEKSLISQLDDVDNVLRGWKPEIISFWDFPHIEKGVTIDPIKSSITIDDRTFEVPILVEFNEKLETTVTFEWLGSDWKYRRLAGQVLKLARDTPILWVDNCSTMYQQAEKKGLCVSAGKVGAKPLINTKIDRITSISVEQLKQVVQLKVTNIIGAE
ncbi:MAG: sulfatase-like hydrolase/transferase, partial [Proteobacteria bacterium]|nr:sulfatase-like hydrolase/transferase [Pseudomonadota bacterium]